MGLDMYAFSVKPEKVISDFDFIKEENETIDEFAYWRKFNALHGWMEKLYRKKGGTESFNTIPLRLTMEDFESLEQDLDSLQPCEGFFWGDQEIRLEDIERTQNFIEKSKKEIQSGNVVYYYSWW